ncbi:gliding motility-associated C-terminal domain-containing protein [Flavobacterium aurantiibacter]|uniref:gliding motility-associated C-terminal domain-containing protein n=1 Tax=Flavobacterium aurantiibacter TaxID=2023067 RepID=UPI0013FD8AC5|nr:gliding motility-associated C-terminal domain-containing protein [Flavobacterium aurantiibacter]
MVGQCAATATLTITVSSSVIPDFDTELVLCSGSDAPTLLPTSPNGISGTWNPSSINNQISAQYIFTPTTGQCATPITLNVVIDSLDFTVTQGCVNRDYLVEVTSNANDFSEYSFTWRLSNGSVVSTENRINVTQLISNNPGTVFPFNYTLTVTNSSGCSDVQEIFVDGIFCNIPKGISPNNDNKNDEFDLTGFGVKNITIFNRYGTEVYQRKNYTNQWKGQTNSGEELPDATYFYVIVDDSGETFTGWVYVNR